jgi:hypothetical protein
MVDVLEEVPVDPSSMEAMTLSVSTGRTATLGPPAAGASLEASGLDTATDGVTTEVAAIELKRK